MSPHLSVLSYAVHCTCMWGYPHACSREAAPRSDFTGICRTVLPAGHMTELSGTSQLQNTFADGVGMPTQCFHEAV